MKNNLPKKTAAKAAGTPAAKKPAVKKSVTAKVTSAQPKAAKAVKKAAAAKPAAKNSANGTAKPAAKNGATKPAAKKTAKPIPLVTTFVAQVEIGWGNSLYLRGEGSTELSWERGILMRWEEGCWVYSTTATATPVCFKYLVNDQIWSEGHNQHVEPGATSITSPHFHF